MGLGSDPFAKKNLSWIGENSKEIEVEKRKIGIDIRSDIELENENFDYTQLDEEAKKFLKEKEKEMHGIVANTYTAIGKILKEAQEKLAKAGYGCFLQWTESLGLKKDKVYSLINRYELILSFGNSERQKIIEALPVSLAYEIAKKNTNETVKEKVLNGEINSLKEFKEYMGQSEENDINSVRKEEQRTSRENYLKSKIAEMISENRSNMESSNYIVAEKILKFLKVIK
jgi:hypothetical protein